MSHGRRPTTKYKETSVTQHYRGIVAPRRSRQPVTTRERQWAQRLSDPPPHLWIDVAFLGGCVVGFCAAGASRDADAQRAGAGR